MATRESQKTQKVEWHLLPWDVLEDVVQVLIDGKKEHGANEWRTEPYFNRQDVMNSLIRHMVAEHVHGQRVDTKSGYDHALHAVCNALFAAYYTKHALWADSPDEGYRFTVGQKPRKLPGEATASLPEASTVPPEPDTYEKGPADIAELARSIAARYEQKIKSPPLPAGAPARLPEEGQVLDAVDDLWLEGESFDDGEND